MIMAWHCTVTLKPRRLANADPLTTRRVKQTDASVS